jgi:AcrR family transcriptional regulator
MPATTPTAQRILAVCVDTVDQGTWGEASLASICRSAGVSNGSLYHHFPSWGAVLDGVYLLLLEDYQAHVLRALEGTRTASACIGALVRAHFRWARRHPRRASFLRRERGTVGPPARARLAAANQQFLERILAGLAPALRPDLPRDLVVASLVGPIDAYTRLCQERGGTASDHATRRLAAIIAAGLLAGRAPRRTSHARTKEAP